MVTTIYLIRHGETEGSGVKRYHGSIDVPLSGRGVAQMEGVSDFIVSHLRASSAKVLASYLMDIQPSGHIPGECGDHRGRLQAAYCSDLVRAVRSAEIVAGPHGLEAVALRELRERNFGIWEGMTFTEIRERYPEDFDSLAEDPLHHSPTGGESTIELRDRVVKALGRILDHHRGGNVLVAAHGGVNRVILCHIMGIPLENIFRIEQDHGAVNIIEFWDMYPVVKLVNGIVHG
jgi:alpha-ribazole phosphatase